ncbi:cation acetate symporter [Quadrisphaera sp. GCM10027208]|uniref:sodium/solute symporter n=1 Tax=Quadrisphaera sp. GCM10027208 TaxID=3273423 RepID=UPI0036243DAE
MTDQVLSPTAGVLAVVVVTVVTVGIGAVGLRVSRTTSDFYVASRMVSPRWNASAISGEYLSAASFLGVAGLVLAGGVDMLWFPVGYTAGYLVLLVLVAAPLRRSGAYTLPDFAEQRLESRAVRRISSVLVVGIGVLYLLPQLQGAGLALRTVTGAPAWVGAALVAATVVLNVLAGGMRSITLVQAFQYWLKLTALAVPLVLLLLAWRGDGAPTPLGAELPVARETTTVTLPSGTEIRADQATTVLVDGDRTALAAGDTLSLDAGTTVTVPAGEVVPHAERLTATTGDEWALPLMGSGREHPLYATYSLLLALFLGTMGLPHVLVRFYTNRDGVAARRTTLVVIGLLGVFYLFPPLYGALGRLYATDLLLTGRTDAVVLTLPGRMLPDPWADLVGALVVAGAFAAFLSTSSGLVVSVAGVLSQDLLPAESSLSGHRFRTSSVRLFRIAAVLAVVVPFALSLLSYRVGLADTVGLAFALAASTFCPLLVLGIWWRGLTATGAVAGLLTGGTLAGAAVTTTMLRGPLDGWAGALLAQPAAWTVPAAFAVMVVVSVATSSRVPPHVGRTMVALHAPERRVTRDRVTG